MLVLSRKLGEKILIGDSIVLTVVKIDRNQIRLGIEAPSDVAIYREEIAPARVEADKVGSAGVVRSTIADPDRSSDRLRAHRREARPRRAPP